MNSDDSDNNGDGDGGGESGRGGLAEWCSSGRSGRAVLREGGLATWKNVARPWLGGRHVIGYRSRWADGDSQRGPPGLAACACC